MLGLTVLSQLQCRLVQEYKPLLSQGKWSFYGTRSTHAPIARKKGSVGESKFFELNHKDEIQHGGKVYHVDNMGVVTMILISIRDSNE